MNPAGKPCCMPGRAAGWAPASAAVMPRNFGGHEVLRDIPGGSFTMGTDSDIGFAADGEGPSRRVAVGGFRIAPTPVTNRQFSDFVRDTRYVSEAERVGSSFVFFLQLPETARSDARHTPAGLPWWVVTEGACWQRPEGPGSHIHARPDHPVVHVSWNDTQAFCTWSGHRLPSEAEWEFAARGGIEGARYPWGDELEPGGQPMCNIWRGAFPDAPAAGWQPGPVAVASFPANGHGLFDLSGNVWEWCADWFSPDPLSAQPTDRRSMRGGSFLCHDSYCNRYRVAARGSNTPSSSSSNCGFRVAA